MSCDWCENEFNEGRIVMGDQQFCSTDCWLSALTPFDLDDEDGDE